MADDFNKVNYDRIFKKQKKSSTKINFDFRAILFILISLIMTVIITVSLYKDIVKHITNNTAQAIVSSVKGSPKDSNITIQWSFTVKNNKYEGSKAAKKSSDKNLFTKFSEYKTGDTITISYNPANPVNNELYERFSIKFLSMLLFIIPFILIGYWMVTGQFKYKTSGNMVTAVSSSGISILLLCLLFCPVALLFVFLDKIISWEISLPLFLLYSICGIPCLMKLLKIKKTTKPDNSESIEQSGNTKQADKKGGNHGRRL